MLVVVWSLSGAPPLIILSLRQDKQAEIEPGRKQMGTIMGKLFGQKDEIRVEDFKVMKAEETAHSDQGNPQTMKKYTFSMIAKPNPTAATTPANPDPPPVQNPTS
jgi:hypothetical protein